VPLSLLRALWFRAGSHLELTLEQPTLVTLSDQFVAADEVQITNAVWFLQFSSKDVSGDAHFYY
jgi:hypothetical protein